MKHISVLLLTALLLMHFSACTADYPDIARQDYTLDRGAGIEDYDCAFGLSELAEKLKGLYDDKDNVVDLGKDIVEAKVEFDDSMLLVGDEFSLPLRVFYYTMADIKTSILDSVLNVDATGNVADVYWDTKYPDQNYTIIEKAYKDGLKYCKDYLATFYAMKDYGFEETTDYIDTYNNILSSFGIEEALDEYYSAYGMDKGYLKQFFRFHTAYMQFKGYLINSDGVAYPTDEEAYDYYLNECVYMQQIVFPYVEVDPLNRWVMKSEEDIAAARERGKSIYAEIGNDPIMYIRNMDQSEMRDWRDYVRGYFYAPYEIQQELLDAYYKLEEGEIAAVDTPIGYYIIKACKKDKELFTLVEDRVIQALCEQIHSDILAPYHDKFTLDEEQYKRYSFDDIITFQ